MSSISHQPGLGQDKPPYQLDLFDALQDFEERIPYKTMMSPNKRWDGYILPKSLAKGFPYIRMNFPGIDYLVFDLDYHSAPIAAQERDLPMPTLTVISPDSNHAHLLYELLDPIPRKANKPTRELLKDVLYVYGEMLCADRTITTQKQLIKNALSSQWEVIKGNTPYSLTELAESKPPGFVMDRTYTPRTNVALGELPFESTLNPMSRNCSLFDNARFYAYAMARQHNTQESLYDAILSRVIELNDSQIPKYFPVKIKYRSELKSIAKSISGWTFVRRHSFKVANRGVMGFDDMPGVYYDPELKKPDKVFSEELARRQVLSAGRTNTVRKLSTERKILTAVEVCSKRGIKPTMANIATLAQVSRKTIYNHKELVNENV